MTHSFFERCQLIRFKNRCFVSIRLSRWFALHCSTWSWRSKVR